MIYGAQLFGFWVDLVKVIHGALLPSGRFLVAMQSIAITSLVMYKVHTANGGTTPGVGCRVG